MRILACVVAIALVTGSASALPPTPTSEAAATPAASMTRREIVIDAIQRHVGGSNRLYAAPHIPANVERNARQAAQLGPDDELLGVSDSSGTHDGRAGLYFLADRIEQHRVPGTHETIYYEQLAGVTPTEGTFVLHYGDVNVDANLVGKARVQAVIADILTHFSHLPPQR